MSNDTLLDSPAFNEARAGGSSHTRPRPPSDGGNKIRKANEIIEKPQQAQWDAINPLIRLADVIIVGLNDNPYSFPLGGY